MKTANERLVEVRIALGFQKKAEFAEKVGIERSTYDKMEKGPHKPSADNLEKIASKFSEVNLNWLLLGQGPMLFLEGSEPAAQLPPPIPSKLEPSKPNLPVPGEATPQQVDFVARLLRQYEEQIAGYQERETQWEVREAWYQEMLKKPLASSDAAAPQSMFGTYVAAPAARLIGPRFDEPVVLDFYTGQRKAA